MGVLLIVPQCTPHHHNRGRRSKMSAARRGTNCLSHPPPTPARPALVPLALRFPGLSCTRTPGLLRWFLSACVSLRFPHEVAGVSTHAFAAERIPWRGRPRLLILQGAGHRGGLHECQEEHPAQDCSWPTFSFLRLKQSEVRCGANVPQSARSGAHLLRGHHTCCLESQRGCLRRLCSHSELRGEGPAWEPHALPSPGPWSSSTQGGGPSDPSQPHRQLLLGWLLQAPGKCLPP